MRTKQYLVIVAALGLAFLVGHISAQDGADAPATPPMPEWRKLTSHHKEMAKSTGEWDVQVKWWAAPGTDPIEFPATAKREVIMNGYFMKETFTCPWEGETFEGMLLQGYDTKKNEYFSVWLDNSSPAMNFSRGKQTENRLDLAGLSPDPMTGELKKTRSVLSFDSKDQVTHAMYDVNEEGEDHKTMHFVYKRKK